MLLKTRDKTQSYGQGKNKAWIKRLGKKSKIQREIKSIPDQQKTLTLARMISDNFLITHACTHRLADFLGMVSSHRPIKNIK